MREAVIVIADLYLQPGEAGNVPRSRAAALPGLEHLGRYGERAGLTHGWRAWLAGWVGRAELGGLAPAEVAAVGLASRAAATRWIATPVCLAAGLTRVHLPRGGMVRLEGDEQATLVSAFSRVFAGSDLALEPLSDGQLLLTTPGIAPLATTEPARCAGGEVRVPQGLAAAPLLRLMAEIEMWLHGAAFNDERRARGAPEVSSLWLWGAHGGRAPAAGAHAAGNGAARAPALAFGRDAWLSGLWRLLGGEARPLPGDAQALFAAPGAERAIAVVELGGAPGIATPELLEDAAAALDARLITPALAAVKAGALGRLTLIANDTRVSVGRLSAWKRWRGRRTGLEAFT